MCHGRRGWSRRGFAGRGRMGERWYDRENVLERLEEYQRDLEQELADVSELVRRLQTGEGGEARAEPVHV